MKQLVNFFGRQAKKQFQDGPRKPSQRQLRSESLEKRQLLAGDLLTAHNYSIPEDVNADWQVTPLDALLILNHIRRSGGDPSLDGLQRGELDNFVDVTGDNEVTALDALRVMNRIARGEAQSPLIDLQINPRTANDQAFTASAFNAATRELTVGVNEVFNLELLYTDLRGPFDRLGAFAIYSSFLVDRANVLEPVLTETQFLEISANLRNGRAGTIAFSLADNSVTPVVISFDVFADDADAPAREIRKALESFGFTNVSVTALPGADTDPLNYLIRFNDFSLDGQNLPNLVFTANLTGAGGVPLNVTGNVTDEPPLIPNPNDPNVLIINPQAIPLNVNFQSRTFRANASNPSGDQFFGFAGTQVGAFDPAVGFINVGSTGPLLVNGFPDANAGTLPRPFDVYSIPVRLNQPTERLRIALSPPSTTATQNLLYGSPNQVPNDLVQIVLENDPNITTDGTGLLFVTAVQQGGQVTVEAGDGALNAVQNGPAVSLNVAPLVNVTGSTATPVITITTPPTRGTVTVSGTNVIYTPTAGQVGADSFVYTATVNGVSDTGTISVNIATAPVITVTAGDGSLNAVENGPAVPLNVGQLVVVTGSTATPVITITTPPTRGTVTVSGTSVIYTPAAGQVGADSFVYTATVGGVSDTGTISVSIAAPVVTVVAGDGNLNAQQNGASVTLNVGPLVNVTGSTATPVITITTPPTRGTVTVSGTSVIYTPTAGQVGADSFVYTATVGGVSDTGTISVSITPEPITVNANNGTLTAVQNGGAVTLNVGQLVSVTGSTATPVITITTPPTRGTVTVSGTNVIYTPAAGQVGADSFVYTATVGGVSDTGTISVSITPEPITVNANNGTLTAVQNGGAVTLNVGPLVSVTGSTATPVITITTPPTRGTVTVSGTNVIYTPTAGQVGADSFVYTATVGGVSDTGTIAVTITPQPITVDAGNGTLTAVQNGGAVTLNVGPLVSVTGSTATPVITITTPPTRGTVTVSGTNVIYTPTAGQVGADSFVYTATVGGVSDTGTIAVTITPQPITVNAGNASMTADENGGPRTLNLAGLVTVTGSTATPSFTIVTAPTRGTATISGSTLTYTPSADQFGSDTLVYRATVGGVSDTGTIAITINPIVAPPIARNDNVTALAGATTTFTSARLTSNDSAARPNLSGQPPLVTAASAIAGVTLGTVVFNQATNSVSYTPPAGFEGDTSFQYTMTSEGQTATATVFVSVRQFVPSTISGTVFTDFIESISNPVRNGVLDANEPTMGGVPVTLTPIQTSVGATPQRFLTDASGGYSFDNLPPGTYQITFDVPDTLIFGSAVNSSSLPAGVSGRTFTVVIGEDGGVDYDGLNFTVIGRRGLAAGTGTLLVSQYLLTSPNSPYNAGRQDFGLATMIVNPSTGEQQVFELTQGFEGVLFAQIAVGRSGSTALLTLLMEDGTEKTAILSRDAGDFVVSSTRAVVQVFRNVNSLTFIGSPQSALQLEYGNYRSAVDQVLASGIF